MHNNLVEILKGIKKKIENETTELPLDPHSDLSTNWDLALQNDRVLTDIVELCDKYLDSHP